MVVLIHYFLQVENTFNSKIFINEFKLTYKLNFEFFKIYVYILLSYFIKCILYIFWSLTSNKMNNYLIN